MLKNYFSLPPSVSTLLPWGGGHTIDTDPTKKGWVFRPAPSQFNHDIFMIGRKGVPGCATLRLLGDYWDVSYHLGRPLEADNGDVCGEDLIPNIPGFGLTVILGITRYASEGGK